MGSEPCHGYYGGGTLLASNCLILIFKNNGLKLFQTKYRSTLRGRLQVDTGISY
jgi:hypothetical protein